MAKLLNTINVLNPKTLFDSYVMMLYSICVSECRVERI